jgi:anaerobic selenocysteine-containing dehydrogenase
VGATALPGCTEEEEEFIVQQVRRSNELPGETVWRSAVCRQCDSGCGIQVRVVDGNAKKIEGDEANPVNRGGVCALGHSLLQEVYNPDRILQAQRSIGERGSGAFETIAYDEAVEQLVEAVGSTPSDRIAIIAAGADRTSLTGEIWRRFANAIGAPPPAYIEASEREVERQAARIALGTDDFPYFDIARSDYVFSIGAPIVDPWRSATHYTGALASMRRDRPGRRGRLVQAEARMSLTAANADRWLPVVPGTEGILARAIAGLILEGGSAGTIARQRYRSLFPDDPPTLQEASETCDIRADWIEEVAADLAATPASMVIGGGSAAATTNGLFNITAALGLNILLDNLGMPGGVFAPVAFGVTSSSGADSVTPIADVAARLRGETGSPVDLLIVSEADPVHALPAGMGLEAALGNVSTIAALSNSRDDTMLHADIVIPVHTELERFELVEPGTSVGVPVLGVAEPVIEPMGAGQHPAEVVIQLAQGLGGSIAGDFDWSDAEELIETLLEEEQSDLPGGEDVSQAAFFNAAIDRGGIFGNGEPAAVPAGPSGAAPDITESRFEGSAADYPYMLMPFESVRHRDGRGANRPWIQEMPDPLSTVMWNSWVEMSPELAEALEIHDGDLIRIESPTGSIEALAGLDATVRPDVICIPFGHGHKDFGRYAQGRGANVMNLIGSEQVDGTSASAWAATRVQVERIGEGRLVRFGRAHEEMGGEGEVIPAGWAPHDTSRAARTALQENKV